MAYEFNEIEARVQNHSSLDSNDLCIEPIIAAKIYDNCRMKDCLVLIARAVKPIYINDIYVEKGRIIPAIYDAGSVTVEDLELKKISIMRKRPSPLKKGFWEIEVEFVYEYILTFYDCDKNVMIRADAYSTNREKYVLFGSEALETAVVTDIFVCKSQSTAINSEPFVSVEARAIALKAEFRCNHCDLEPADVAVTIGLLGTIKLFCIVGLDVVSRGFCIPPECDADMTNPCDFFGSFDFTANLHDEDMR